MLRVSLYFLEVASVGGKVAVSPKVAHEVGLNVCICMRLAGAMIRWRIMIGFRIDFKDNNVQGQT